VFLFIINIKQNCAPSRTYLQENNLYIFEIHAQLK